MLQNMYDIIKNFAYAFNKYDNEPLSLNLDGEVWTSITKKVPTNKKNTYITISFFPIINKPTKFKYSDINLYISKLNTANLITNNIDLIAFEGLSDNDLSMINLGQEFFKYKTISCVADLSTWTFYSKINCASRRSERRGVSLHIAVNKEDFIELLKIVRNLDFASNYMDDNINNQSNYFLDTCKLGYGIGLLAKYNNNIIGGMYGLIIKDTLYMLINGYDITKKSLYVEDFLYYNFIKFGLSRDIKYIDWGSVASNDYGLIRMKKKYSNSISSRYTIVYYENLKKRGYFNRKED